jgi:ABC-type transport system involved in multi-copper enzyme maturation permease subunit
MNIVRLARFDVFVHRKYLFLGLLAIVAFSVFRRESSPMTVPLLVAIMIGPLIIPFWTVGNDRLKGTICLLASLPIPRWQIALAKALGTSVLSLGYAVFACLCVVLLGGKYGMPLGAASLVAAICISASFITTAVFLVVSSRVGSYVSMVILAACAWFYLKFGTSSSASGWTTSAVLLFFLLAMAIFAGAAALWSSRPAAE